MDKENPTKEEILKLAGDIYKKTLGYELDRLVVNDDGTTTHLHSDRFLDEPPERKDSPEFTKDEEEEEVKYIMHLVEKFYDGHSLFHN